MKEDKKNSYFGSEETDIEEEIEDLKKKETSQWQLTWLRFKRHKLALFGLGVMIALILSAIFAPFVAPHDPYETNPERMREGPSWDFLLGTDDIGRCILSRLIFGARIALMTGLLIVGVSAGIGVTVGLIAGATGGWVDALIMRIVDAFMAFPVLIFALGLATALGRGIYPVIIAAGFILWTRFARVTRGDVLSIKNELYIESAKAIGESRTNIILKYYLPNILPSVVVIATIIMPSAILYQASLNFLGIGGQPPLAAWGTMVAQGQAYIRSHPHMSTFAGLAVVITVLAFNFVGDGLRDALDPVRGGG